MAGEGYNEPVSKKPFEGKPQGYADLAKLMASSWASFFVDLDPNGYNRQGKARVEKWTPYSLSDPKDLVFDANVTSHLEADTWRAKGIKLFNDNVDGIYHR